jgi:hypothetical protein
MHLPKPFTGHRTSGAEGGRGDESGKGSTAGGAPDAPKEPDAPAIRTVLPGLRRPQLTRPTVTGYASTLAAYVGQTSCDPAVKPGTLKLSKLLTSTYPGTSAWSPRPCGLDGPGMRSEHYEGRGLDWSVTIRNRTSSRRAATVLG